MTEKRKKLKPLLLTIFGYGALGSALVFGDQIRRIYNKVAKATSTDVLSIDRFQPTYIYIEDPYVQEEIAAGVTLSKERLKLTRFHKWLYDKIEESFVFRNWLSYRKNQAWRFLRLAEDENRSCRRRAVRSLASLTDLTDADYQQLAQACDLRTAVGLARSTDNVKFLLDPPYFKLKPNRKEIVKKFRDFFTALDSEADHPCLQYFVSKVVLDLSDADSKGFDDDFRFKFDNREFIPMCLEALLHHSWTDSNAKQILKLGGLSLLTEVYKYLNEDDNQDIDSLIVLSKLMSNISACPDSAHSFFISGFPGWIKLLSILSQHKDIRVSAPAQRALANFDEDDIGTTRYLRRIYPLHPTRRTLAQPKLDVVFIHGLLGGIFITWRQRESGNCTHKSPLELLGLTASEDERERAASYQTSKPLDLDFFVDVSDLTSWAKIAASYEFVLSDIPVDCNSKCSGPFYGSFKDSTSADETFSKCWPKDWLAEDCPDIRLIGVNYETNISRWTPLCPVVPTSVTLRDRSLQLSHILSRAGVGKRPVVWIGHSMGGLLVKGVLSLARASSDPETRSLFDQTKAIVFYSTPHKGSHLAALNPTSQMIVWPSVEVQELRENSPGLLQLHDEFLDMLKEKPFKVISFAERESTHITALKFEIRFVGANSADPDVGENYGIPLDHLCICKPAGRQSFLYQKVRKLIQEVISETET